jgi:hypothetical protein
MFASIRSSLDPVVTGGRPVAGVPLSTWPIITQTQSAVLSADGVAMMPELAGGFDLRRSDG